MIEDLKELFVGRILRHCMTDQYAQIIGVEEEEVDIEFSLAMSLPPRKALRFVIREADRVNRIEIQDMGHFNQHWLEVTDEEEKAIALLTLV